MSNVDQFWKLKVSLMVVEHCRPISTKSFEPCLWIPTKESSKQTSSVLEVWIMKVNSDALQYIELEFR